MPFDGTGFEEPRKGPGDGTPAHRPALAEALSWALSFCVVWIPFLAAVLWIELS